MTGQQCRQAREKKGLSLRQFAAKTGWCAGYLWSVESEVRPASAAVVMSYVEGLTKAQAQRAAGGKRKARRAPTITILEGGPPAEVIELR